LRTLLKRAKYTRAELVVHLKSENSSAKDYVDELIINSGDSKIVRIPTATLRELFIFNEAYGMREKIWRHVGGMLQLYEEGEASAPTQSKDLTDIVCMPAIPCFLINGWFTMIALIFSKFQDKTQAEKSKETPKAKQNKNAWLSRSLVLVLGTENRLILTCHDPGI
jgi:hypothetical protein